MYIQFMIYIYFNWNIVSSIPLPLLSLCAFMGMTLATAQSCQIDSTTDLLPVLPAGESCIFFSSGLRASVGFTTYQEKDTRWFEAGQCCCFCLIVTTYKLSCKFSINGVTPRVLLYNFVLFSMTWFFFLVCWSFTLPWTSSWKAWPLSSHSRLNRQCPHRGSIGQTTAV